jgi:hypothetical protein
MQLLHTLFALFTTIAFAAPSPDDLNEGLEARACLPASCVSKGVSSHRNCFLKFLADFATLMRAVLLRWMWVLVRKCYLILGYMLSRRANHCGYSGSAILNILVKSL